MHFNKKVDWLFSPVEASSGKLCYSSKNSVNRNCSEKQNYYQNVYKSNKALNSGYVSLDLKPKVFIYHAFSHIQRKQEQLRDFKKKQVIKHS